MITIHKAPGASVRAGAEFKNGKLVERPHQLGGDAHAA